MNVEGPMQLTAKRFADADVPLVISNEPFVRWVPREVFMMDVLRGRRSARREEHVRIWPGTGAETRVLGVERRCRQVVLCVDEPVRTFFRTELRRLRGGYRRVLVPVQTPPGRRRFLVGMDESHLFVAQLPTPVTSVAQAHASLRPAPVDEASQHGRDVVRQGEWFFVGISAAERTELREAIRNEGVRHDLPAGATLGRFRGRPHRVTDLVAMPGREYARGAIRHPDHRPVVLEDWMRVHHNLEAPLPPEINWVD